MTAQVMAQVKTRVRTADAEAIAEAARLLAAGGLVAFPTETVYGLGADASDGAAVARLYAAKGRPSFNPLIAHVASAAAARKLARFDAAAARLADAFWPGPLTLVLPKAADCPVADLATAGLDSIAVRVPAHPIAQDILRNFGGPVVAPSANRSGHVSPTTAAHVLADLDGRVDLIVDGGATPVGVESTIVACLDRRAGAAAARRRAARSDRAHVGPAARRRAGAMRTAKMRRRARRACWSRTMRRARRCGSTRKRSRPAKLCWLSGRRSPKAPRRAMKMLNLSARGDPIEAAANLFSHLRALDAAGATAIAVMPIPDDGLGEAINDRLRRAAR